MSNVNCRVWFRFPEIKNLVEWFSGPSKVVKIDGGGYLLNTEVIRWLGSYKNFFKNYEDRRVEMYIREKGVDWPEREFIMREVMMASRSEVFMQKVVDGAMMRCMNLGAYGVVNVVLNKVLFKEMEGEVKSVDVFGRDLFIKQLISGLICVRGWVSYGYKDIDVVLEYLISSIALLVLKLMSENELYKILVREGNYYEVYNHERGGIKQVIKRGVVMGGGLYVVLAIVGWMKITHEVMMEKNTLTDGMPMFLYCKREDGMRPAMEFKESEAGERFLDNVLVWMGIWLGRMLVDILVVLLYKVGVVTDLREPVRSIFWRVERKEEVKVEVKEEKEAVGEVKEETVKKRRRYVVREPALEREDVVEELHGDRLKEIREGELAAKRERLVELDAKRRKEEEEEEKGRRQLMIEEKKKTRKEGKKVAVVEVVELDTRELIVEIEVKGHSNVLVELHGKGLKGYVNVYGVILREEDVGAFQTQLRTGHVGNQDSHSAIKVVGKDNEGKLWYELRPPSKDHRLWGYIRKANRLGELMGILNEVYGEGNVDEELGREIIRQSGIWDVYVIVFSELKAKHE